MIKAVDLIVIVLGAIVIGSAFLNRKKTPDTASYSSQTMNCVKGIFAIMIVLFHLSQHISGGMLFRIVGDTGYLSVAVFFFISGYGLYTRVTQTRGGYCKGIISRRIPRVLLPWMIATLFYALYWFAEGGYEKIVQICNNRENGYLLITNSWFVIAIAVFYFVFYLAFNWYNGDFRKGIIRSLIGVCLFIVMAYMGGLGGWWVYSSLSFILGITWKEHEIRINHTIERKWLLFLFVWGCIFAVGYVIRFVNSNSAHSPVVYDIALLIASSAFVGMVFTVLKKASVNNRLWSFLGSISFEIYLLHELVYNILRNRNLGCYIGNDLLYVGSVILISTGCAYLFKAVITRRIVSTLLK